MVGRHKTREKLVQNLSLDNGVVSSGEGDRGSVDTVGEGSGGVVDGGGMVDSWGSVDKRS